MESQAIRDEKSRQKPIYNYDSDRKAADIFLGKYGENLLYSEAAELLHCSYFTVAKYCHDGKIRSHGIGQGKYVKFVDLWEYLETLAEGEPIFEYLRTKREILNKRKPRTDRKHIERT